MCLGRGTSCRGVGITLMSSYPTSETFCFTRAMASPSGSSSAPVFEEAEPPVVLLGHSLGGIACVDLLVEEPLEKVKLLVTVGSQSPLFYEMDALQSLRYGQPLPDHFPKKWLNIFDRRDFLSYIGAQVFPDPLQRIEDIEVNNRRPFPQSHGAYWANDQTWKAIIPRLP